MVGSTAFCDDERDDESKPVGEILEELLTQYEANYPGINVVVMEMAAPAA